MKFEVDGTQYQIWFQHDPPHDWEYHIAEHHRDKDGKKYVVTLELLPTRRRKGRQHKATGTPRPSACLECTCGEQVAGVSSYMARELLALGAGETARQVARELCRETWCFIERLTDLQGPDGKFLWAHFLDGHSRLKPGEAFSREAGRQAALVDALPGERQVRGLGRKRRRALRLQGVYPDRIPDKGRTGHTDAVEPACGWGRFNKTAWDTYRGRPMRPAKETPAETPAEAVSPAKELYDAAVEDAARTVRKMGGEA